MAVYTPPTETLPIFDNSVFPSSDGTALTIATGRDYFLTYPVAQGSEIFPSNITLQSSLTDSTGSKGLSSQVLSSTGTGTQWVYSGLNGYSTYTMSSLPFTLPTTNFSNLYVLFTGTGSGILTIPISGFTTGTFLSIKNISSGTLNISTSTILFSSTAVTTSLIALYSPYTISLYFNGSNWIQTTVSSKMNDLEVTGTLTTANLSFSGSLATDGITQTASVVPVELYSTTTSKNIYFGGGLATPVHTTGPIIIGSDSTATGGINIGTGTNQTTPTVNTVNIGSGTYGTNIKGTLGIVGSTTVSSGSNLTLTSGNVSCTAGEIFAPTVRNSANSGSISTAGIVTGTSIVCPSYGPASNSTDVSFCALATGNINIGTGTRSTSGKAINIGNGATSTSQINIGVSTNTTSIQGILLTASGTLAGKIASFAQDTLGLTTSTVTLDPTTLNLTSAMYFFGSAVPTNNYIIGIGAVNGQTITFKHIGSATVTLQFTNSITLNTSTSSTSTTTLTSGSSLNVIYNGGWYQTNATTSLSLTGTLTAPTISGTTSVSTPLLTSSAGLSIGTTGSSSITLGASGIATTLNSDLTVGSNRSLYTTLGQQIRLGHATTQTTGTATSSFGPFFRSFGPASFAGVNYDLPYDGTNGFVPTGTDGWGGMLTIYIKTGSGAKIATYIYSVYKRVGTNMFGCIGAIATPALGWTVTPTVSQISAGDNTLRVTLTAGDVAGATIAWTLTGSI